MQREDRRHSKRLLRLNQKPFYDPEIKKEP